VLDSFKTRASPPVLLDIGDGDPDEPGEAAPPTYICLLICDVNVSYVGTHIFFLVTTDGLDPPTPHHSSRSWENLSRLRWTVAESPATWQL
jgi:hypothetical protein